MVSLNLQHNIRIRSTHINKKRNYTLCKENELKGKMEMLQRKEISKINNYIKLLLKFLKSSPQYKFVQFCSDHDSNVHNFKTF